jgi:hypothetical protein
MDTSSKDTEDSSGSRFFRLNNRIVTHKISEWPDRCVICNSPANGYRFKTGLWWSPRWALALGAISLPLAITFLFLISRSGFAASQKPLWSLFALITLFPLFFLRMAEARIGLCTLHRNRRRRAILAGVFLGGLSIALTVLGLFVMIAKPEFQLLCLVLYCVASAGLITSVVWTIKKCSCIRTEKIEGDRIELSVEKPFLESIPVQTLK